jgi:hypothetical protein
MADTRPDIQIQPGVDNDIYALLNAQAGFDSVDIGDPLCIQNKSGFPVYIHQSLSSQQGFATGIRLEANEKFYTDRGIAGCTATCSSLNGTLNVSVSTSSPASLSSGRYDDTRRVKTDPQPTSFEENRQFKIFHRFNNVAGNEQIVYWFNNSVPVNIKERTIRLKEGKREYLVIPDPQDGTYDSVLAQLSADETPVRTVNSNLEDSGLASHPTSDVTVLHGVGTNLFTIADDDQFPNGDLVGVGAQGNNALNPNSGVDSNLSGVAANSAFFLVQIPYENEVTSGQFFLLWEEI